MHDTLLIFLFGHNSKELFSSIEKAIYVLLSLIIGGDKVTEPEKEIEKNYSYDKQQLIKFLDNLKNEIDSGEIKIGEEQVKIPDSNMDVEYGFKIEGGQKEIEIEIKWNK
ncbi:MAG: amphi-Trp domain-containing protein [Methanolobus sp.]|nr:amphi-Trp domain-containing protein [Methanolobus sp.]